VKERLLQLDDDELSSCVACGLCLAHCPTFRVTGDESASPRGRIASMRAVQWGGAPMDADFSLFMDECVQCRACEVACPSSVPFGHLMEGARQALSSRVQWWKRIAYRLLSHHRLLLVLSTIGAVLQRMKLTPSSAPPMPLRRGRLKSSGSDVVLFTGCVMDAWMRDTHAAAQRVIESTGAGVHVSGPSAACCGALAVHAGLGDIARGQARAVVKALPGDAPILVDSAGCGAAMKEYGHLLGTPEAEAFAARVQDVHEWLAARADALPPPKAGKLAEPVCVQDPCHLRHVQRAHQHVHTVLARYAEVVTLDDEGLCCGAGGAYSVQQPELSFAIRDRKLASIARSGARVVASANPGCAMHLAAAGLDVRHPVEIIDEAINGR
jgi:glycolate oxidase iron-sulfur subunit